MKIVIVRTSFCFERHVPQNLTVAKRLVFAKTDRSATRLHSATDFQATQEARSGSGIDPQAPCRLAVAFEHHRTNEV